MAKVGLYRVQNADGSGPYNSLPTEYYKGNSLTYHGNEGDDIHPMPRHDGLDEYISYTEKFAFASLKQLMSWFSTTEISWLTKHGFSVYRVWVDTDRVKYGNHQCTFVWC
jgi:hypothetical protein